MKVTFLEATNGLRLSKQYSKQSGFQPYPHVKSVTSHRHDIPVSEDGLEQLEKLIREHGRKGHCMLKGDIKRDIIDESRAGLSDKVSLSNLLIIDIDGIVLPHTVAPKEGIRATDVNVIAQTVISLLPKELHNVSYIAQASSSLGFKAERVSLHIFMLLTVAMPPKTIKLWLESMNYRHEVFRSQLALSVNGQSLKFPIDTSVADNSKVIFIAPPTFNDPEANPFVNDDERIILVKRTNASFDLGSLVTKLSPQSNYEQSQSIKNDLRIQSGFKKNTAKIKVINVDNESREVLTNPDQMSINVADTSSSPYIRCNINGGDSGAYYFNINNPIYMYNFKDEPIFEIEKADKEFYASIADVFQQELEKQGKSEHPVIFRDFNTDTYFNGIYDPNVNQFTKLRPSSKNSLEDFMRSYGRPMPDFVPDADMSFDPACDKTVDITKVPYYINTFTRTEYMLNEKVPATPLEVGYAVKLKNICPLIYTLIKHMLGDGDEEVERFINWLAYIYQNKQKTGVSWVLSGVPGTGKGVFSYHVLKPLLSESQAPMKTLENMEEQFNSFMQSAMILVVDEFHMASSPGQMRMANKLKANITNETITIRAMRSNGVEVKNYTNFIFLTNHVDAIKIEHGDRRYNIAPRQEVPLREAHPDLIENIPNIKNELYDFAGVLSSFRYNESLATTAISNEAKDDMRNVSMSVFEEFCEAIKRGKLDYFVDTLEIAPSSVFNSSEITTAQRFVKAWVADAKQNNYTVIPLEHLRTVFHVQTEQNPRISPTEFRKRILRNNLKLERKRAFGADRHSNPIRGINVENWVIDPEELKEIISTHFKEEDQALLRIA